MRPFVFNPNKVPLSYTRLNSAYRPRRISCHSTSLSENSIQKLFETSETLDVNIQDNKQQLTKNLKGIISTKKIILLKQLEEDFKKTLLKQMKNSKR